MQVDANPIARAMYGFNLDAGKALVEEAARAVSVIYAAGLMFDQAGALWQGGNNVAADLAAGAFTKEHLAALQAENGLAQGLAAVIDLRQSWYEATRNKPLTAADMEPLRNIYEMAQALKRQGWRPERGEPHRMTILRPA